MTKSLKKLLSNFSTAFKAWQKMTMKVVKACSPLTFATALTSKFALNFTIVLHNGGANANTENGGDPLCVFAFASPLTPC